MDATEIVSDADIERIHGNASFGTGRSKRQVVDEGVLSYAFGYTTGHTMLCILLEHGLVKKPKPGSYRTTLTIKGGKYLRAVYGPRFREITELANSREAALTEIARITQEAGEYE